MGQAVKPSDFLDQASLANPNSAIRGSMRYFAVRIDNVPAVGNVRLEPLPDRDPVPPRFSPPDAPARFVFSTARRTKKAGLPVTNGDEGYLPGARLFLSDDHLRSLAQNFHDETHDVDKSQQIDATREICSNLLDIANSGMADIQRPSNFYQFDRTKTKEEIDYRQYVIDELNKVGDRIVDLGH